MLDQNGVLPSSLLHFELDSHRCWLQEPAARLATIEAAGQAHVPYTSGLLIGIGETRLERIQALLALHSLHSQYEHIQVMTKHHRLKQAPDRLGAALHLASSRPLTGWGLPCT